MAARRRTSFKLGVTGLGERQEIAPGLFINTFYRGCTPGFVVTDEGLILIDTPLIPKQAKDWREQIELEAPGLPILYVFNTDHHRGHALGNQYFLPTTVIAHERAFKEMSGYTENFKERVYNSFKREPEIQEQLTNIEIVLPGVTFTDCARLQYGGREIQLIYAGGHTRPRASPGCRKKRSPLSEIYSGWTSIRTWPRRILSNGSKHCAGSERLARRDWSQVTGPCAALMTP